MRSRPSPVRVLLVDDEPVDLEGRRSLLARYPTITVVAAIAHADLAVAHLDAIDVAVVDMWERRGSGFDRYPGIEVAQAVRARHPRLLVDAVRRNDWSDHVTVIAISRHVENIVLGKRMQEAGVDLRFDHDDDAVADPDRLADLICVPQAYLTTSAGQEWRLTDAARRLGMTPHSTINALLQNAAEQERRTPPLAGSHARRRAVVRSDPSSGTVRGRFTPPRNGV